MSPTWQEIGMPGYFVETLKNLRPGYLLDSLIFNMVFHNVKRLHVQYHCEKCSYIHIPSRLSDEVTQCPSCNSKRMRCHHSLKYNKFDKQQKIPQYSRKNHYAESIIRKMSDNYKIYYANSISSLFRSDMEVWDWSCSEGEFKVSFSNGESLIESCPRVAICKAALLCPYLWDSKFDWANGRKRDNIEQKYMTGIFTQFLPR